MKKLILLLAFLPFVALAQSDNGEFSGSDYFQGVLERFISQVYAGDAQKTLLETPPKKTWTLIAVHLDKNDIYVRKVEPFKSADDCQMALDGLWKVAPQDRHIVAECYPTKEVADLPMAYEESHLNEKN